jgi:hypothetical protein
LGGLIAMTTQRMRKVSSIAESAIEDMWQRRATEVAIAAARGVVKHDGPIPLGTPIGRLSDTEWGWIVAAILFGWIRTRAEQATAEHLDVELTIRTAELVPDPWDAGAVVAILPDLAGACPDLDWSQPLTAWSKETMTEFLLTALRLVRQAMAARDRSERGITRNASASTIARQANAGAGGPLMTAEEWDDPIGF